MAHEAQQNYLKGVKQLFPLRFKNVSVVDIGSLDINGNNRYLFEDSEYIGVDVAAGKNVDVVSKGHEYHPEKQFDVVLSTECLEHDKYYRETLLNMLTLLKPGGILILTFATTGRPEHGTRRTTPQDAPLLQGIDGWEDYYKNLTLKDLMEVINLRTAFKLYEWEVNKGTCDFYFWGIKKEE